MNLRLLAVLAVLIGALMVLVYSANRGTESSSGLLLPQLKSSLGTASELRITGPAEEAVTLLLQDGIWRVQEMSGYPADLKTLSAFLNGIAAAEIAEHKTARAENHARLGVADVDAGEGAGTSVWVQAEGTTYELIVAAESVGRGSLVRLAGENQVYLTDTGIDASGNPMDWLDPVIFNVDSAQVASVAVRTGSGETLTAVRNESTGNLELENLPEGAVLKYSSIVDNLARILVNPRFLDVRPVDEADFAWLKNETRVTLTSGDEYVVRSAEIEGEYWLHLDHPDTSNWLYRVSEYAYGEFNKTLADMIQEETTED